MARLRRTSPDQPGWARRRVGRGFSYTDADGALLGAPERERVEALVIPPAWADVWITPYAHGHLQAVGTDEAGRRQYLYHPQWRAQQDEAKFDRMIAFGASLTKARAEMFKHLSLDGLPAERAAATAVRLLDLGYFRIGNDIYADTHGSFGLTTLERRHVRRSGTLLVFRFVGKSGVDHRIEIDDAPVIEVVDVMRRRRSEDPRLMAFKQGRRWQSVVPELVNDYVRETTGVQASAKDFRTWHATVLAAEALATSSEPGRQHGLAQASRERGDEGGCGVPWQHTGAGALVVRRSASHRGLQGRPHDQLGATYVRGRRRASGDAGNERRCACSASAARSD